MSANGLLHKLATRPKPKIFIHRIKHLPERPAPNIVAEPVSHEGTDVLNYLRQEYKQQLNGDQRWSLFKRGSESYAPVGSLLTVTYIEGLTGRRTMFSGFMLCLRRNTANPTFILRSIIDGVPVEQVFSIFAPSILKIECNKRATCLYGNKAYWIRDNPEWQSRFHSPPDQKVSIRKIRLAKKAAAEEAAASGKK